MDSKEDMLKLKERFEEIISKYNFNQGTKTQELVNYILSKNKHSAQELAKHFNIEEDEAHTLLQFFKKGIEFKQEIDKQNSKK